MQDEEFCDLIWSQIEASALSDKVDSATVKRCVISLAMSILHSEYEPGEVRVYMEQVMTEWEEDESPPMH